MQKYGRLRKLDHTANISQLAHKKQNWTPRRGSLLLSRYKIFLTSLFSHQDAGSAKPRIPYIWDKKGMHLTDTSVYQLNPHGHVIKD